MADLALVNANVLTMDPARPRALALTVAAGRIEAVTAGPVRPPELSASRTVDLRGATGRVGTYPDGRPSGLLEERAQALVGMLVYPSSS